MRKQSDVIIIDPIGEEREKISRILGVLKKEKEPEPEAEEPDWEKDWDRMDDIEKEEAMRWYRESIDKDDI